uniref:CCHC-type domain-containing protein n=1 Tax=Erpetoichthys calabaricus TaxID=27687 RepID=A0A8C4XHN1_ERPCA
MYARSITLGELVGEVCRIEKACQVRLFRLQFTKIGISNKRNRPGKCNVCGKPGHWSRQYRNKNVHPGVDKISTNTDGGRWHNYKNTLASKEAKCLLETNCRLSNLE